MSCSSFDGIQFNMITLMSKPWRMYWESTAVYFQEAMSSDSEYSKLWIAKSAYDLKDMLLTLLPVC